MESGLNFLDISYAVEVTDEGMMHFKDKTLPITKLFVNGLTGITGVGLQELINSCKETVKMVEIALMDQEHMTG